MNVQQLLHEEERARQQPQQPVDNLSNETYRRLCHERLDAEVREIAKRYQDSASEAWKYSVRGGVGPSEQGSEVAPGVCSARPS